MGVLLDTENIPDITHLLLFIGKVIFLNEILYTIYHIEPVIGGIKIKFQNENGVVMGLNREFGGDVIDIWRFEEWMEEKSNEYKS